MWNDGVVVEAAKFALDRPYIMQRIHTIGYRVYNVAHHIRLLNDAAMELFGFATLCREEDARRIIVKLLEMSRVSDKLSCPVVMRLNSSGALSFEVEQPSYNAGCYLRASRLNLVLQPMAKPTTLSQTSLTVAMDCMADAMVANKGGDVAVWVDDNGDVISRPWMPMFAVYRNKVYTPAVYDTVEYCMVRDAVARLGLELIAHPFSVESLMRMEELFIADVLGLRCYSVINDHRFLSVVAARIAQQMEPMG